MGGMNAGWHERATKHAKEKIVPLMALARELGIRIVHAPHGKEIAEYCKPLYDELIIGYHISDENLSEKLKSNGINTLLYAGYAVNWCILNRKVGLLRMYLNGFNTLLIRDCTIAFEMPETLKEEWCKKVAINIIEHPFGSTTTLNDIQQTFFEF